jgi:hypothetical protein
MQIMISDKKVAELKEMLLTQVEKQNEQLTLVQKAKP